jgi:NAD(P)-dependent dehydrogenase (short-subunit alcohol dehydrogenase family)
MRLENKVALITGGTSGMGKDTVSRFIEEGANVVLTGRSEEIGQQIADEHGERCHFMRTDVSNPADVEQMISWTQNQFGRIDCLFNNAGAGENINNIEEVTPEQIQREFDLLVVAVLMGMKHVVPIMKNQGGGSIVNNASIAGIATGYGPLVYSVAKAAVIHATKWVAMEVAPSRIRVNSISPGAVYTPIFAKIWDPEGKDAAQTETRVREAMSQIVPVGRVGDGRDVGSLLTFLASDESSYITGQDIAIDGGISTGLTLQQMEQNFSLLTEAMN